MAKGSSLRVSPPANEDETRRQAEILFQAFAGFGHPLSLTLSWVEHVGREYLRLIRRGGEIVGGLGILPFGQWFGGRSVRCAGITMVGVAPDARGSGIGKHLLRSVVRELCGQGYAITTLYPSTYPIYRGAGYEVAGQRINYEISIRKLGVHGRTLGMRCLRDADRPALVRLYAERARRNPGNLDRCEPEWQRILELPPEPPTYSYVVEAKAGKSIVGYVVYKQAHRDPHMLEIQVRDYAFRTADAGRRILTFFSDHMSMSQKLLLESGPADPLLMLARDPDYSVQMKIAWMLRILDVTAALEARGYPAGVTGEVQFEVTDELLEHNNGRFVLRVADGRGRVHRGGRGKIKTSIRGLAPLFTGYMSAEELCLTGLLSGSASELATASPLFAGPAPWTNDHF
ncbi:MAG: GNAT family N-acetyltransferase [Planctomycetes bacterium]|nr:GNAT family N-acetyltransferase [Planctomycetota bacterium]